MSNKKIFKKLYSNKINKNQNYQAVLKSIENQKIRKNTLKTFLIPTSCVLALCTLILFVNTNKVSDSLESDTTTSNQNNTFNDYNKNESNQDNIKNEITNDSFTSDLDIKIVDIKYQDLINSTDYYFIDNLNIPSDLEHKIYQAIYLNENKNSNNLNYNVLNNYRIYYQNINDNREINISFSNHHSPINNTFNEGIKIKSKINNNEITIYQKDNLYNAIFTYNDINFYIETINIEYKELISLLSSIIKEN